MTTQVQKYWTFAFAGSHPQLTNQLDVAGPADYQVFLVVPIVPVLLVLCFISRARSFLQGVISAVVFSAPISIALWFIWIGVISGDSYERRHTSEVLVVALMTLMLSAVVLGLRAFRREKASRRIQSKAAG